MTVIIGAYFDKKSDSDSSKNVLHKSGSNRVGGGFAKKAMRP